MLSPTNGGLHCGNQAPAFLNVLYGRAPAGRRRDPLRQPRVQRRHRVLQCVPAVRPWAPLRLGSNQPLQPEEQVVLTPSDGGLRSARSRSACKPASASYSAVLRRAPFAACVARPRETRSTWRSRPRKAGSIARPEPDGGTRGEDECPRLGRRTPCGNIFFPRAIAWF